VLATHVLTVSAGVAPPNLREQRAQWLRRGLVAWDLPADAASWTFRLYHAPDGGMVATADGVTGGESVPLTLDAAGLPPEARRAADRELRRLRAMSPQTAEYQVARTYLETIASLPWARVSEDRLDLETALRSVGPGAAGSWSLNNLAPRALKGDFAPGFLVDHFVKDLGIVLAEAKQMKLALPGVALAEQLYVAAQAQGHGRDGTQVLLLALAALSDVDWSPQGG